MFNVAIWGTVAAWVGSLSSGGALITAATYYIFDRRREHRNQAEKVVCWIHPNEHGPFLAVIKNFSDQPVFDVWYEVLGRSDKDVRRELTAQGVPKDYQLKAGRIPDYGMTQCLVDYHDRVELASDKEIEKMPDVPSIGANYFEVFFRFKDATGRTWRKDARTGKFVKRRRARRIRRQLESYTPPML